MKTDLSVQDLRKLAAGMQNNRLLRLTFARGDAPYDVLLVNRIEGEEYLSRDFRFIVEILSDDANLDPKDFVGKQMTVRLLRDDGSFRYFNGFVFSFRLVKTNGGIAFYEAELCPWLRYLTLRKNNRLFLDESIRGQSATIFEDYGVLPAWDWQVNEADPPMTMACQFDEHDHNYVHRRWEHLGLCYWFEHTETEHKLIVSDPVRTEPAIDGSSPTIPYQSEAGSREADGISSWSPIQQETSTHTAHSRADFKDPGLTATTGGVGDSRIAGWDPARMQKLEWHEYAGSYGFRDMDDGQRLAGRRIEAIEAVARQWEARGNNRFVMPGRWFRLTDHFGHALSHSRYDDEYLITFAHHTASNNYLQGVGVPATYSNRFTCVRRSTRWRPLPGYNSERTRILAPQTATVVGPEGESLYTDEYGRCLVQFHWDREGKYTTWVRVSSGWAGGGQGINALPRIGSEVIVQWLDGNTDHPLVTGRVINATNQAAWRLPHQRALTGIRSRELVGAAGNRAAGRSNHLILDDTANAIQAQLRSDHGASQLSVGSITRIENWQGRQDARGEGFELRTDAVGAIRSGRGMLVSTESRPGGRSHIADVGEPVSRLTHAQALHDELGKLAQKSGAQDDARDQGSVADALQTHVEGIKGNSASRGDGKFPELSEPHLVLAGARGLQATTPATAHVSGGDHVALTAGQNVSIAAGTSLFASVVDKISLFAQRAAIRVSAAMGDIILHAISSSIKLESAKSIQLLTKVVQITGVEKLELHGGKTRLVLDDSGAQIFTPGKFVAFAASHSLPGPQDAPVNLVPKGICIECMLKAARGGAALLPR